MTNPLSDHGHRDQQEPRGPQPAVQERGKDAQQDALAGDRVDDRARSAHPEGERS